jgi:translocation and assembly module TamB
MAAPGARADGRWRRRVGWGLGALGVLGALVVAAVAGALAWLHGASGAAALREQVLAAVGGAIEGRLEVRQLSLDGEAVHAEGLRLFTPEGALVAELQTLDARVRLGQLAFRRVTLEGVRLGGPRFYLASDPRGLNLVRAVQPRHPGPEGSAGPPWLLSVRDLTLGQGFVSLEAEAVHATLEAVEVHGKFDLELDTLQVRGALELGGRLSAPLDAPVTLAVQATGLAGSAQLAVKDCSAKVRGDRSQSELSVDGLELAPATMAALVSGWPLRAPVTGTGSWSPRHAQASLRAGEGTLEASASFSASPFGVPSLVATARDLDLAALVGAPRPTRLAFTLKGSLSDVRPEALGGGLDVDATWDTPQGVRLLALAGHAEARGGTVRAAPLRLTTPGARLELAGTASLARLNLEGAFSASDLSGLPASARALAGVEFPALGGAGALRLELRGPPASPQLVAKGALEALRVGSVTARGLEVDLELPDATRPLHARALLRARRLEVGGQAVEAVRLQLTTRGQELEADLASSGLGDLALHLGGRFDEDSAGATLSSLTLTSSGSSWALTAPTHLAWAREGVELEPLSLADGAQRLVLEGHLRGQHLRGAARAVDVDLGRLPPVLVARSLGLAGLASLDATVDGALPWPEGELTFGWRHGAARGVSELEVTASARWRAERLSGKLAASSSLGTAAATFDVPVPGVLEGGPQPLAAAVTLSGVDTVHLEALLGRQLPLRGVLGLELTAGGTGATPSLSAVLFADGLEVPVAEGTLALRSARVEARTGGDGALQATATALVLGGSATVTLGTPLTLPQLRRRLPTWPELEATPWTVGVDARALDLGGLAATGLVGVEGLAGRGAIAAALAGTLAAPTGTLTVELTGAGLPGLQPLDAAATLTLASHRTSIAASAGRAGSTLATAEAALEASGRELLQPELLGARAGSARVSVQPVELSSLLALEAGAAPRSGTVAGTLELTGTLAAPTATLRATAQRLRLGEAVLGDGRLEMQGNGTRQQVLLSLDGGGALDVKGTLGLPLTLARVGSASAWEAAPVALEAHTRALEVSFLSGIHPLVPQVGGHLDLQATVGGTLGAPILAGDARLTQGRLALLGYGEYHDLELALHATDALVVLEHLTFKAGGGGASLKGRLERSAAGRYHLTAEGSAEKLPIVFDDQLRVAATAGIRLEGEVSAALVDLTAVDLTGVVLELPEVAGKNVQALDRPRDVVLVRVGRARAHGASDVEPPALGFKAVVRAPRNLRVRGTDLDVELGLSEGFRLEALGAVQINGVVTLVRGDLTVIGRKFVVREGGTVRFAGPADLPQVDLAALYANTKEQVKVTIAVTGRGTDLALRATSEPPMPETEIYALLATGRRELRRGSGASLTTDDALSVVGQLATSQLRTVLAKRLPIDVLSFEASGNFARLKFDVGKYLSDSLYLGVSALAGADVTQGENPWAARLEYQLSHRWSLQATVGTAPAGSADVVWSFDF